MDEIGAEEILDHESVNNSDDGRHDSRNMSPIDALHSISTDGGQFVDNVEQPSSKNMLVRRFSSMNSSGTIPLDAKVVMLMKPRTPGERPTFVRLEPVVNSSSPDAPYQHTRRLESVEYRKLRKRRILPPVEKKKPRLFPPRRGRPPKQTFSVRDFPSTDRERVNSREEVQSTTSSRPRRTLKAPERYGEYYQGSAALSVIKKEQDTEEDVESEEAKNEEKEKSEKEVGKKMSPGYVESDATASDEAGNVECRPGGEDAGNDANFTEPISSKNNRTMTASRLKCERCMRTFANHNSLNAHRFKVHQVIVRASVKCPGCEHRATTIHTLNDHLVERHDFKPQYITKKFANVEEFQTFLDNLAATENVAFVLHRKSESKRQLYCNRSGQIRTPRDSQYRHRPRKGTAKIGAMCPAHLFYSECDDGSILVEGQMTHFGHTLDPRYVFPATSGDKITSRMKSSALKRMAIDSMYGRVPLELPESESQNHEGDNVGTSSAPADTQHNQRAKYARREDEQLDALYGPLHPKAEEIDIRMKNIDRLCSFLFDNISEPLYRLDDSKMDIYLRALRSTQNSISNLASMMIQIKDGDPDVVRKFQRRGQKYSYWSSFGRLNVPRRRQKQQYDTEDYDEDTVYYRHVPFPGSDEMPDTYMVEEMEGEDEYIDDY